MNFKAKILISYSTRLVQKPEREVLTALANYNYTSGKNHFHEMNGDVGMAG